MKFKEAKDTVLQLINLYSERGVVISSNDKNIADFEIKARNYLNIALKTVSNRFPLTKTTTYTKVASEGEQDAFSMPANFLRIIKIYKELDGEIEEYNHCYWVDDTSVAFPAKEAGTFQIRYEALSNELPEGASAGTELDIQTSLESAVCYYAAGMLIQSERPDVASRLFEQYSEIMYTYQPYKKLQRKIKRV